MGLLGFIKRGLKPIATRLPIHKVKPQIVELRQDGLLKGRTALVTGGTSGIVAAKDPFAVLEEMFEALDRARTDFCK